MTSFFSVPVFPTEIFSRLYSRVNWQLFDLICSLWHLKLITKNSNDNGCVVAFHYDLYVSCKDIGMLGVAAIGP